MNTKIEELLKAAGVWSLVAGGIAVLLVLLGAKLAAVLVATSALLSVSSAREAFARYGLDASRRRKARVTFAAAAGLVLLLKPPTDVVEPSEADGQIQTADLQAQGPEQEALDDVIGQGISDDLGISGVDPLDPIIDSPAAMYDGTLDYLGFCTAIDGDTIKCGLESVRLLGIDAPEMPGHCRAGRTCAPGDPYNSKSNLQSAMASSLRIRRVGKDQYGRTIGIVYSVSNNLSCHQLSAGSATYVAEWDDGALIASECG